jgi:hypothetical protein
LTQALAPTPQKTPAQGFFYARALTWRTANPWFDIGAFVIFIFLTSFTGYFHCHP